MKGNRTQTTLRLPDELMEQIKAEAQKRGKSRNCFVVNLLWKWLMEYQSNRFPLHTQ